MPFHLPQCIVPLIAATAVQRHDGQWFAKGRDPVTGLALHADRGWFPIALPAVEPADALRFTQSTTPSPEIQPLEDSVHERLLSVCSNALLVSNLRICVWFRGAWSSIWMRPKEPVAPALIHSASGCIAMDKVHIALVMGVLSKMPHAEYVVHRL